MPTTYAHWAFGRECISLMPENLQKIIHEHRDIYNLGVHGPDIFFYDLMHSEVVKYGTSMHHIPFEEFIKTCKKTFFEHDEKPEMLAYIMGFLSHFVLDSTVHGYVEHKREVSEISHNFVEAQWDRHIIELDDRKPNLVDRAESLRPNKKNAKVISYFFPFDEKVILRTCKWQRKIVEMQNCMDISRQKFYQRLLRKAKLNDYADLFIGFTEDEKCLDSNKRLDKLFLVAYERYSYLMKNMLNYLNGNGKLDKYFNLDLAYGKDYRSIPVLPYKKELAYKIKYK